MKSLTKEYQMGYDRSLIKSLKNYKKINLIGMGGSILGTQAIYDFFKHKIKIMINFNMTDKEYKKLGQDFNNGYGALTYTAASRMDESLARAVSNDPNKIPIKLPKITANDA